MADGQKTRFAILGLLNGRAMSGYDIKKYIDAGLAHFWGESYGQLYPMLSRLTKDRLVRKTAHKTGRRRRHVYTILPKGRAVFREWLQQATDGPNVRNEFLLKIFLSSSQPHEESRRLIEAYRCQQQELLEQYSASEKVLSQAFRLGSVPEELQQILGEECSRPMLFCLLTLRHGLRVVEARISWCDDALRFLRRHADDARTP